MDSSDRPVWRSRAWLAAAVVLGALGLSLAAVGVDDPVAAASVLAVAAGLAAAVLGWVLLRTRRERRAHEEKLTAWAAERAAQAERLRIARELHDLASHGLGLITVRAAAARRVTGAAGEGERARALADIEQAGRAATTELRRMLTVLRSPGEETATLRPAESLADLPGVLERARRLGLAVDAEEPLTAHLGAVSAGVQLAVCAIVREALANAARHAGPTGVRLRLRREGEELVSVIEDDGPVSGWRPQPGAGLGLLGLQERVVALDGSLSAGSAGRGFRLVARLPDGGGARP